MKNLKVTALVKDPDALAALAIGAGLALAPSATFDRVVEHPTVFGPLLAIVFGGRYTLRALGVTGTAKMVAATGHAAAPATPAGEELTDAQLDELARAADEAG